MSGRQVSCECWCPCENVIYTDIYDTRTVFVCDECEIGSHEVLEDE